MSDTAASALENGAKKKRVGLVILGMHRSGTSALARVLRLLGADLPRNLVGSGPGNKEGHWEPQNLVDLNESLLAELGGNHFEWQLSKQAGLSSGRRNGAISDIGQIIALEYPNSAMFVLQDPRISRLVSLYYEALAQSNVIAKTIFMFRNPIEACESLSKQSGLEISHCHLLWLQYNLEAEFESRGHDRAFFSFKTLLNDWTKLYDVAKKLEIEFPLSLEETTPNVSGFLKADLQHQRFSDSDVMAEPLLRGWLSETYDALMHLKISPNARDALAKLDHIRQEFKASEPHIFQFSQRATAIANQAIAKTTTAEDALTKARQDAEAAVHDLSADFDERSQKADERVARELAEKQQKIEHAEDVLVAMRRKLAQEAKRRRSAEARTFELACELTRFNKQTVELKSAKRELGAKQNDLDALKSKLNAANGSVQKLPALQASIVKLQSFEQAFQQRMKNSSVSLSATEHHGLWLKEDLSHVCEQLEGFDRNNRNIEDLIEDMVDRVSGLQKDFSDRAALLEGLSHQRQAELSAKEQLEGQLADLQTHHQSELRRLEENLVWTRAEFRNSTSWKLTAPIRGVSGSLRGAYHMLARGPASVGKLLSLMRLSGGAIPSAKKAVHVLRTEGFSGVRRRWNPAGAQEKKTETKSLTHGEYLDRLQKEISTIASGGLFDVAYYLKENTDVREAGISAVAHYCEFGWKEGRNPSPNFSTLYYLKTNPDVRNLSLNPLWHFQVFGRSEGRSTLPSATVADQVERKGPRILFVGHSGNKTGAEVVLLDIVSWYADHTDYLIDIVLLSPGILTKEYEKYGEIICLASPEELSTKAFDEFLRDDYHVIYLNTVASSPFYKIWKEKYQNRTTKLVMHVHEMENVIRTFIDDFSVIKPMVTHFIAASNRVKTVLVNLFDVQQDLVAVHQSCVPVLAPANSDIAAFRRNARESLSLPAEALVICGGGTLYWRKGPDLFYQAIMQLIEDTPDQEIYGVWLGNGPELQSLVSTAKKNGMQDRIRFVGFKDNAAKLIAAGDIFFLSSREDPFPLVCLEAAQFGIPTVCFAPATGITEFIRNDAGLALADVKVDLAKRALRELLENPETRAKLGSRARERFLANYTSDQGILKIFCDVRQTAVLSPRVSVIVPNFNHAQFLPDRLNSVLDQRFKDTEVIVLDDASTDDSLKVIEGFTTDPRIAVMPNDSNSGSPFKQWKKGFELASAPLVWVAESDDTCSDNFLTELLPALNDKSVSLSYCRTEIINEYGDVVPDALTPYLTSAHPTKFLSPYKRDGLAEVNENFGAMCTIVNASSVIFRKSSVVGALEEASQFAMCGDWHIYLTALKHGALAYTTEATNYFRRHQSSQVHQIEGTDVYFEERFRIAREVVENFPVAEDTLTCMQETVDAEWARFTHKPKSKPYAELFDKDALRKIFDTRRENAMSVAFYVHGFLFSKGGIERLASQLANHLVSQGHSVTIYCRVWSSQQPVYQVVDSVKIVPIFDETQVEVTKKQLRDALAGDAPDVFIPMLSEWLFEPIVDAAHGLGFPIIASEHNDPWKIEELWWSHEARVKTFEKVDGIHLLLEGYKDSLPAHLGDRTVIIPNGVDRAKFAEIDRPRKSQKVIIGVGRLSAQKRFDRLINAFAKLDPETRSGWRVKIFGEGPEQNALQTQIDALRLQDYVNLCGPSAAIEHELAQADFFVSSSEFEGLPMVILEAQAAGLPCVAYRSCNAMNSLLEHGIDGLLAEDDEDGEFLAEEMAALVRNSELVQRIGQAARSKSTNYALSSTLEIWSEAVCNAGART